MSALGCNIGGFIETNTSAVTEAEKRGKEASYTRKRAREALDHVVYLMETEKKKNSNGNRAVAMPVMDVRINNDNSKVVAANQVSEALKSVALKENGGGIALSEVQNKMRVVASGNEDSGIKSESGLLVAQEQSPKINLAMQENIGLQP